MSAITPKMLFGVFLFAVATAIIYAWGLYRQMNQSKDLMNLLFSNGESKLRKYMKSHDSVTQKEVEEMMKGLTAKFPFSANKAAVTDPKDFAEKLLDYMIRTGQLEKDHNIYRKGK